MGGWSFSGSQLQVLLALDCKQGVQTEFPPQDPSTHKVLRNIAAAVANYVICRPAQFRESPKSSLPLVNSRLAEHEGGEFACIITVCICIYCMQAYIAPEKALGAGVAERWHPGV